MYCIGDAADVRAQELPRPEGHRPRQEGEEQVDMPSRSRGAALSDRVEVLSDSVEATFVAELIQIEGNATDIAKMVLSEAGILVDG